MLSEPLGGVLDLVDPAAGEFVEQVHDAGVEGDQDRGAAQGGGDVQQVLVAVVLHLPAEIAHPLQRQPQAARGGHSLAGEGGKLGVPVLGHTSSVRPFQSGRPGTKIIPWRQPLYRCYSAPRTSGAR